MAARVAYAKAKGRRFQQSIESLLKNAFPHLVGNDIRSTAMGVNGDDLILSPQAQASLPYQFEIKCQERLSIWRAVHQQLKRQRNNLTPCIVVAKNHAKPVAVVPFDHFCSISTCTATHATDTTDAPEFDPHEAYETTRYTPKGDNSGCLVHLARGMLADTGVDSLVTNLSTPRTYTAVQYQQWNLRIWTKNYMNLWKIYEEHTNAVRKGARSILSQSKEFHQICNHDSLPQRKDLTPGVVFSKTVADAPPEHPPLVYVALPFASFLDLVVQKYDHNTNTVTELLHNPPRSDACEQI